MVILTFIMGLRVMLVFSILQSIIETTLAYAKNVMLENCWSQTLSTQKYLGTGFTPSYLSCWCDSVLSGAHLWPRSRVRAAKPTFIVCSNSEYFVSVCVTVKFQSNVEISTRSLVAIEIGFSATSPILSTRRYISIIFGRHFAQILI